MIRRFSLVRRRPDLSREDFLARWTGEHVDVVEIDAEANRLDVDLPGDEIAARLAAVEHPPPRYPTGVLAKYARLAGSAATGARVGA